MTNCDFATPDDYWVSLARSDGFRLPRKAIACTSGAMERWLRKLGVTGTQYREWTGGQGLKAFIEANPTWSLRAWVGVLLEWVHDRRSD